MPINTARYESLTNLAALLHSTAETLRLFSDTNDKAGDYMSDLTALSLRLEENALTLTALANKEIDGQV